MDREKFQKVEVTNEEALWEWFEENHAQDESIWLVTWKAAYWDKYVSRDQVLDALIAYGWIDGRRLKLDDHRTMQLLSKRKQQAWAASYQARARKLIEQERMTQHGRAAIERSKASGKWDAMAHVDALHEPEDLVAEITSCHANAWWSKAALSYRRNVLRWIAGAKKQETRMKRIKIVADHAGRGEKVPQY
ncbi:YdeI/OmpD-associated family protein [Boseongicola sp. H5]|uniref:YdeI/OmpD-associated family protein n=1 Tax=Boseongicola sp. H5 TaxID=2763261 RepID=UPI001D0AA9B7|nr:YdeI/OmpD-associated family protein [Boseongicola sp. H5]